MPCTTKLVRNRLTVCKQRGFYLFHHIYKQKYCDWSAKAWEAFLSLDVSSLFLWLPVCVKAGVRSGVRGWCSVVKGQDKNMSSTQAVRYQSINQSNFIHIAAFIQASAVQNK